MDCSSLENLLHAFLDSELVDAERLSVETHLALCQSCRIKVDAERAALSMMRAKLAVAMPRAPLALRAKLEGALRTESRKSRQRTMVRWSAAAAGIAVCAVAAHHSYRSSQRRLYDEDAASRHARHFPMEIERPSPDQIEAWFGGKLDHRVAVPRFTNVAATGGRLLNVRGHQAAYIEYDAPQPGGERRLGLFVYGDKGGDVDVGPVTEAELGHSNGYNVVSWRDGDVVYQLVTDLDENDIRAMLPQRPTAPQPTPAVQPVSFQH